MRRLLVVALAAGLPAFASAQTVTPPAGQLRTVRFDALNGGSLFGIAHCNGTKDLEVAWTMQPSTTGSVASGRGTVRIFASNKPRTATSGDPRTCWLGTDSFTDTTIKTFRVAEFNDIAMAQNQQFIPGSDLQALATAFGLSCSGGATTPVYLCALPYQNSSSTEQLNGVANGTFNLDTTTPPPVSGVTVQSGDASLVVKFTEATSGTNATDFRADATRVDGSEPTRSATGNSSPIRIGGLTNDVDYNVTVIAISAAENESPAAPSPPAIGTPHPSQDFWDFYQSTPGAKEQGGCATGAAGALGVLGAAALLRLRRRKP